MDTWSEKSGLALVKSWKRRQRGLGFYFGALGDKIGELHLPSACQWGDYIGGTARARDGVLISYRNGSTGGMHR